MECIHTVRKHSHISVLVCVRMFVHLITRYHVAVGHAALPRLDGIIEAWKSHIEFVKTLNGLSAMDNMSTALSVIKCLPLCGAD